jgi:hypothetical protein
MTDDVVMRMRVPPGWLVICDNRACAVRYGWLLGAGVKTYLEGAVVCDG